VFKFNQIENSFEEFGGFEGNELPNDLYITDLNFDNLERLWISTYKKGVFLVDFQNRTIQNLQHKRFDENSLISNATSKIYMDRYHNTWISSEDGVSLYDPYLFKFNRFNQIDFSTETELSSINSMAKDKWDRFWLATNQTGILLADPKFDNIQSYSHSNSALFPSQISDLKLADDELWVTYGNGMVQIFSNLKNGLDNADSRELSIETNFLRGLIVDSEKNKWFWTLEKGLLAVDSNGKVLKQISNIGEKDKRLPSLRFYNIVEDYDKNLWFLTQMGPCKYNTLTEAIDCPDSLSRENLGYPIFRMKPMPDGTFYYFLLTEGLYKYDPHAELLEKISKEEIDYTPFNIVPYKDNIWMGTSQGIVKLDLKTGYTEKYNSYSNLHSIEFRWAHYQEEDGTIYLTNKDGINWFHPNSIEPNPYPPNTVINSVSLLGSSEDILGQNEFEYQKNSLVFEAAALHYSIIDENTYRYRILNLNDEWVDNGNSGTFRFNKIPPGDYTFQVSSANYDGVWDTTPASYPFTILKPWYATNTAMALYVLLFVAIIYTIYYYLKSRWQLQAKLAEEHREAERLKELDVLKNRLYSNISHEFRTPLTLISGPVQRQLEKKELKENEKGDLQLIKRNSDRLLTLVDQLMDLSKLESGNLELSVSHIDLQVLVEQIVSSFAYQAREKNLKLISELNELNEGWVDKDILEKILTNLFGNAIKYTPSNGVIKFEAKNDGLNLNLKISNNGVSLSEEELPKLFERYYQKNKENPGAGIGLALVKELTLRSYGSIEANLINKDELQFTVSLPVNRERYAVEETINPTRSTDIEQNIGRSTDKSNKPTHKKESLMLIVEDDKDIRKYIASIFHNQYEI
ncbi:MAG: triple tyrosine motif-containing protein, partial [Flavobacteriaceae bacterium]|nr:triple tyrosine motif-containing protein [Flavobacteriaceae bacterium]